MDANGTRYHLLLGREDWARCRQVAAPSEPVSPLLGELWAGQEKDEPLPSAPRLAWDAETAELTLQPRLFLFLAAQNDVAPTVDDRRGAGRDRYGNTYWVGEDRRSLRVQSSGSGTISVFWPMEPPVAQTPSRGGFGPVNPPTPPPPPLLGGLTVTAHHYLVVGTVEPAGLLVFDLHAGGPPSRILWPDGLAAPFDLAPTRDGGVLLLDRTNRCFWRLDASFHPVRTGGDLLVEQEREDTFQPADGRALRKNPARTFPEGVSLEASSPLAAVDPISIESLADGRVLVLDRGETDSRVLLYRDGAPQGSPVPLVVSGILAQGHPTPLHLVGHDFAFIPDERELAPKRDPGPEEELRSLGRLYVVSAQGNQTLCFRVEERRTDPGQLLLTPLTEYLPMRLFGGKALVASGDRLFYDFPEGFIPLVAQRRPRYEREAVLRTPILDGRTPDCVWHRLFLDACIPPGTSVQVRSRATQERSEVESTAWSLEPVPYLRSDGSELPWVESSTGEHRGTWELLFQHARGQYLQLELTLRGPGNTSPRLHALRAYYPRFSYAERYLPAIYRQGPDAANFLERFLANMEGFFTTLEDRLAAVQVLFDARSAPAETLDWLADWYGLVLDPAWDETRRRLLLRHALDFYQWRGTPRGLRMALRLALDDCPDESIFQEDEPPRSPLRIVEHFRAARLPVRAPATDSLPSGIRTVVPRTRWEPSQGGAQLADRYGEAQAEAGLSPTPQRVPFPLRAPTDKGTAALWDTFSRAVLGFVPSATDAEVTWWREFLTRRYRHIGALNAAWSTSHPALSQVPLPTTLPEDGPALVDWYHFESVVLPMRRAAHRFSVVLPVPKGGTAEQYRERLEQARRVVSLEKPAHTVFDVKFYWAMFRVGEARLGVDTLVDLGSRAPELMTAMVLGRGYLAESYLAASHPGDVADRHILGRDRLAAPPTPGRDLR
ncbi:phage tail-like protein [Archangium gephyra]|uniref:NHL repeat domain protein n=1 Tax=Archangium gephyra TaxID=48 RepID=A0AAC8Q8K6_9BACT|nr:phage tail protein [Archangium gephyra]AKJ02891.1 NHL repeat domain protein [Archangium gephyra]REG25017.1 phage tail-like protein [Archangium gephyra]